LLGSVRIAVLNSKAKNHARSIARDSKECMSRLARISRYTNATKIVDGSDTQIQSIANYSKGDEMKKKDAIVKTNPVALDKKVAGTSLMNAAAELIRDQRQRALVDATAQLIKQAEEAKISRDWCDKVVDFLNDKLKALRAGQWYYAEATNMIIFNRADLNQTQPEKYRPENVRGLGGRV
jgi:hypothetical protein